MLIAYEEPGTETIRAPVLKVFDGDGFKTMLWNMQLKKACEVVVRLGFTDAPELEQPGGKESKAFLASLIADRWVELVVLLKMDTGGVVDRHGRIVCVPYLADDERAGMMRNIELEMILNGWTWVLDRYEPDPRYFEALDEGCEHPGKHPYFEMVRHGVKDATTDRDTIKMWHSEYPTMNYGVATRGIAVVDTDSANALADFWKSIEPPFTMRVKTSRGFHFYFRGEVRTRTGVRPNLDIKSGAGSYVMGPGSIHESGKRYILMDDVPLAEITEAIRALSEEGGQGAAITAGQPLPVGMRNTTLTKFAGYLNSRNVPPDAILNGLLAINDSFSSEPLSSKEVRGIVKSVATRYPAKALPEMISFAEVPDDQLEWLWFPFISFRTLCLLDGNPGEGKSQFTTWLCARISRGDLLPNGDKLAPANCFLCNFEDHAGAVIKKRLEANSANLDRVFVQTRSFRLDQEMVDWLEGEIVSKKVRLVVLDPIQAVISKGTDANNNVDVREFMDRLREVAERNNCSIICVRHFGKASHEKAMMKGIGSTDFVGIARNQLGLGRRKDGVGGFVLTAMKQSYGELGGALFTMSAADARKGEQPRVKFDRFVEIDADEFFGTEKAKRGPEQDEREIAKEFLLDTLADGPKAATTLKSHGERRAISASTLDRARKELGIVTAKEGKIWVWSLPPD